MLTRNILILYSLGVLLVRADFEAGTDPQAMSTDQDSTSDEAPTESMNAVSPDLPSNDEPQYYNGATAVDTSGTSAETGTNGSNGPKLNVAAVAAASSKTSTEDKDEDESADSDEAVKNAPAQRATKPQKQAAPPAPPAAPVAPAAPAPAAAAASGKRRKPAGSKRRSRPRREI